MIQSLITEQKGTRNQGKGWSFWTLLRRMPLLLEETKEATFRAVSGNPTLRITPSSRGSQRSDSQNSVWNPLLSRNSLPYLMIPEAPVEFCLPLVTLPVAFVRLPLRDLIVSNAFRNSNSRTRELQMEGEY